MRRWRTLAAVVMTTASLFVVAGGCIRAMTLLGEAMEQGAKPNGAVIALFVTIVLASVLFMGARAISKESDD